MSECATRARLDACSGRRGGVRSRHGRQSESEQNARRARRLPRQAGLQSDARARGEAEASARSAPADLARRRAQSPRFVIQQHDATRLHWDLRLEREGTLASWALPRGLPLDPHDDRVAVHTEDHPLEYLDFHGEIPRGSYGAGTMIVFDHGTYEVHEFTAKKVEFTLHGERNSGRYGMFPIGRRGGDEWLIHRMEPPQDPDRERLPEQLLPMLAKAGELPPRAQQERWGHEVKWDGIRALLWCDHGQVRIESRTQREITDRYPEVKPIGRALAARGLLEVLLDGELVALDDQGKPSFERLQGRMNAGSEAAIRRAARGAPVTYVIFDLLHRDGRSLLGDSYEERRAQLDALDRSTAPTGASPPTTAATAARCWRRRASRGWRGSSPSGSTRPTSPAAAAAPG